MSPPYKPGRMEWEKKMSGKYCVELCMGSSCYSRGNSRTVQLVEQYVQDKGLEEVIDLRGRLCTGQCASGPCVTIDEKKYTGIVPEEITDLLDRIIRSHGD